MYLIKQTNNIDQWHRSLLTVQMQEEMGQNIDLPKKYFVSNVENAGECRND